jgi:protein-S-isoprenylcysteine O-methyltransferase Ste14
MLLRALLAFLALPGVVAFAVPLASAYSLGLPPRFGPVAAGLLVLGLAGLAWCVWAFYTSGKGTLAPWSPPRHLVTHGLYRYSRNPMYCSVLLLLAGWAVLFGSTGLAWYTAAVAIAFHMRVVLGEEPWLEHTHGQEWLNYKGRVRRWFGRVRGLSPSDA